MTFGSLDKVHLPLGHVHKLKSAVQPPQHIPFQCNEELAILLTSHSLSSAISLPCIHLRILMIFTKKSLSWIRFASSPWYKSHRIS